MYTEKAGRGTGAWRAQWRLLTEGHLLHGVAPGGELLHLQLQLLVLTLLVRHVALAAQLGALRLAGRGDGVATDDKRQ